jgi:hypothetical protein
VLLAATILVFVFEAILANRRSGGAELLPAQS